VARVAHSSDVVPRALTRRAPLTQVQTLLTQMVRPQHAAPTRPNAARAAALPRCRRACLAARGVLCCGAAAPSSRRDASSPYARVCFRALTGLARAHARGCQHTRFDLMSTTILTRIDDLGSRLDELEAAVGDLAVAVRDVCVHMRAHDWWACVRAPDGLTVCVCARAG
jgi:hypothetical protein